MYNILASYTFYTKIRLKEFHKEFNMKNESYANKKTLF